jgi:DNA modification methylase
MKLTKEDIDKVRHIEGFPIGKDEDIIALSNPPYYTACPNPFIEDFIKEHGKPYDEATDDYHREPFAADVSEGKYDPLYKLHSYPTKVPPKAISRYIEHYTNPGDIVLDGFCGTGMTGIAAQTCKHRRYAILSDLSPTATYISSVYNSPKRVKSIISRMEEIISNCRKDLGWIYETNPSDNQSSSFLGKTKGYINYTVWSKVVICPHCGISIVVWDRTITYDFDKSIGSVIEKPTCQKCGINLDIAKCEPEIEHVFVDGKVCETQKYIPVLINYTYGGKRLEKTPSQQDLELINKISNTAIPGWYPKNKMMNIGEKWGDSYRAGYHKGITRVDDFFTRRSLMVYSYIWNLIEQSDNDIQNDLRFICTACFNRTTKMVRYMAQHKEKNVGPLSGTLYLSPIFGEINVIENISDRFQKWKNAFMSEAQLINGPNTTCITTQSTTDLQLPSNSIDYIFVDPPFGDNLMYSELNFITDAWLKVYENNQNEAIINNSQGKLPEQYKTLMKKSFERMFTALKPNRWITVEFHNSKNLIWNIIQEAIVSSGFIIADVRTLDKKKGTTKQMVYTSSVKQDLVISAYKPKESFRREFELHAGTEETAWSFVRQHLEKLPVVVFKNGKIELIAERQAFLLYDRMVAYHIMNGIAVPLDATDFYKGLDEKFLKRDGMYFLADQVNEYDTARIVNDVEPIQFELFVTNEKSAIAWLYQQLETPQTYAELQPKFMQEIKAWDKFEVRPELAVLLEENFLQDDKGRWYIPDITKAADVAKLREKKLLKEFEGYLATKGKLKLFRTEAIRVGFAKLWADKNYKLIVETAERLPEKVIQEDDKLLMYYDISLGRI